MATGDSEAVTLRQFKTSFSLDGCTIEEAAALDGETLTVTTDEGEAVEVFEGYILASVAVREASTIEEE